MDATQVSQRGIVEVPGGEPEHVGDRRDDTGSGRPVRACDQRLDWDRATPRHRRLAAPARRRRHRPPIRRNQTPTRLATESLIGSRAGRISSQSLPRRARAAQARARPLRRPATAGPRARGLLGHPGRGRPDAAHGVGLAGRCVPGAEVNQALDRGLNPLLVDLTRHGPQVRVEVADGLEGRRGVCCRAGDRRGDGGHCCMY